MKKFTETAEAWRIVDSCQMGVLSLLTPEGAPYGVPLNFWRAGNTLYFHSAREGRKIDCLRSHPQVSICFVESCQLIPERMTTRYASALVQGTAREITDRAEKLEAVKGLCRKYQVPETHPAMASGFASCLDRVAIWAVAAQTITGKSR